MAPIIEVEHLVKTFGPVRAVDDISFEVEPGEVFGFLGPNGAGKTTTINILCTLQRPTSGRATLCGLEVTRHQHQVRQCLGLVFQDPSLDDRMTAWDNLDFHALIYGVPRRRERIEEVLRMVGLWERRGDVVRHFSGGMRRRLEIARGLLHHPRVLFLDEPTLGLDPQTRAHIWEHLHQLRREIGITLFFTTHYMDEAENAGRIAIIDRGRLVALDTPEALKQGVGGDVLIIRSQDDGAAAAEIREGFGLSVSQDGGHISLEVANGSEFIPSLTRTVKTPLLSITVRRPTLDDVFLKLAGRGLREEQASGRETMQAWARLRMRRGGR